MPLSAGSRVGHYEVGQCLGVGGMGEVYQARDIDLDREVAIKVLPADFAADLERLARLEREAKLLASLNHPNIAAIHSLERDGDVRFLAMELVPGKTLAELLAAGPLPLDEARKLASQIAHALEAAHAKGIIHRDLKPANIKITPDGRVKLLDFGLAKAMDARPEGRAGGTPDLSQSPTVYRAGTMAGMIMGTAAYMSPEQARGKPVDAQTDIWAFGCVVFEMVTGRQVFAGETVTDILAGVVGREPDWQALPAAVPSPVRLLLRRCLQKDQARRIHHVADARLELEEAVTEPATAPQAQTERPAARWVRAAPWAAAASLGVLALFFALRSINRIPVARQVSRVELSLPPGLELFSAGGASLAVSPDGLRLAFVLMRSGVRQVDAVRRIDQVRHGSDRGTENANSVFFSPDGDSIGFIQNNGALRRVSLGDGLVQAVGTADTSAGAAWTANGQIIAARDGVLWEMAGSLTSEVSGSQGTPENRARAAKQLTTLDATRSEVAHRWPVALPGGRAILFSSFTAGGLNSARIEAFSFATGQRRTVVDRGTFPVYAAGHLVFYRDGTLLTVPFDGERLEATGPPTSVIENLTVSTQGALLLALSDTGSLTYLAGGTKTTRLVWVTRDGAEQPLNDTPRNYQTPRLAPDGHRVVVDVGQSNLWMLDSARSSRLTVGQTVGNSFPVWTPDGKAIFFRASTGIYRMDAGGGGAPQNIPGTSASDYPTTISPDGKTLVFTRLSADTSADIYALSLLGNPDPHPILASRGYEGGAQFSPDGHWLAYASDESGHMDVYVRPFPSPDKKVIISTEGGTHPMWSRQELFYRNGDKMMSVSVSASADLAPSAPRVIFDQRYSFGSSQTIATYDVSRDGQRFVMVKEEEGGSHLNLVLNWFDELTHPARISEIRR